MIKIFRKLFNIDYLDDEFKFSDHTIKNNDQNIDAERLFIHLQVLKANKKIKRKTFYNEFSPDREYTYYFSKYKFIKFVEYDKNTYSDTRIIYHIYFNGERVAYTHIFGNKLIWDDNVPQIIKNQLNYLDYYFEKIL